MVRHPLYIPNKVARSCATTIISCFVFKLLKLLLAFLLLQYTYLNLPYVVFVGMCGVTLYCGNAMDTLLLKN